MLKRTKFIVSAMVAIALAAFGLVGCSANTGDATVNLTPQTDAVIEAGYLTVGIDTTYAPFAGESGTEVVGIDVDVAAALAEQLGLELKLIDLAGADADTALKDGEVDCVMNLEEVAGSKSKAMRAAAYVYDAPALFRVSSEGDNSTVDLSALASSTFAAQSGSLAAWTLEDFYPSSTSITSASTLTAVFDSVSQGTVTYGAADLIRGAYCALSYENVHMCALLSDPEPIYIGVSESNTTLASDIASAIDALESGGILEVILSKWLGSDVAAQALPSVAAGTSVIVPDSASESASSSSSSSQSDEASDSDSESGTSLADIVDLD